eukprot:Gb_05001 [translate_table: standard]
MSSLVREGMAIAADEQYLPYHTTKTVKYIKRRRILDLLHLACMLHFFYHRFFGAHLQSNVVLTIAASCELLFALIWFLNHIPTWFPIDRVAYPERISLRYNKEGEPSKLPSVDVFITTADPWKEPPLILVNTVLSVLAVDYPPEKMACYVSDDGGSAFNLFALLRAYEFGNKWIPFCRKFRIEPRAPMPYFSRPIDKSMINNSHFTKEWEGLKEQYLKLKLDIATAMEARLVPKEAQEIFNELSGHQHIDVANHPGIIKVFQKENDFLPELIYVSREKRPGFKHHFKAGALNALARVSGVLTNSPFILNLDCDMYVNNSQALLQSMCFHLDPAIQAENRVSFVQFPQCFGDIDENDTFARKMSFAFDVVMKGLDGFQGPLCCGTGCVQRRDALYGSRPGSKYIKTDVKHKELHDKISETPYETLKKKFGKASEFIQLISCDYEASTEWGQEVGWMYGSSTEDIMTGFKLHTRGWRTIFYSPDRPAFVGTAPTVYSEILQQRKRWSTGMLEIFMSRNCPLFTGYGGLMPLQRAAYVNYCASSLYSIPLVIYGMLPTFSFITGKPFIPKVSDAKIIPFVIVFVSMHAIGYIEGAFIGINAKEWWNAARMWMTTTVSSVIVAVFEVFLKVFGLREAAFSVTPKKTDDGHDREGGVFMFDSSFIFVPPTTFVLFNIVGLVFGVVKFVVWGNLMLGELFCVCWILINLFHFVKGLFRGQSMGGLPKQTILKSASCACLLYYVAITLCH